MMQLLTPLQSLKSITSVAELFRDAEDARKVVQEKVAGEMDALSVYFRRLGDAEHGLQLAASGMTRTTRWINEPFRMSAKSSTC